MAPLNFDRSPFRGFDLPSTPLSHEVKWMQACVMMAPLFSTCSRRQYFAVVLSQNKRVVGVGYNGAPPKMKHCVDGGCPRGLSNVGHGSSYEAPEGFCIAQHAEAGALLWSDAALRQGGTIIVNGPPCLECARLIASSGLKRVCYRPDASYVGFALVESFLSSAGVQLVQIVA